MGGPLRAIVVCASVLSACASALPAPDASNALRSIRTVDASGPFGERGIEIELFSPQGFPVRNEIAVLRIGTATFLRSRYPQSGDTRVLIYFLTQQEFAALANGDRVSIRYGMDPAATDRWEFGTLDKGRVDRR